MKYLKQPTVLLLTILMISCTKDDPETNLTPPILALKSYTYKKYDTSNNPNLVRDSINFQLENNRIISSSGINQMTTNPKNSNSSIIYTNEKIAKTSSFQDGIEVRTSTFLYDNDGNLSTHISKVLNTQFQKTVYYRHTFNHSNDTILAVWERSTDGTNYDDLLAELKIVLDANNNRTYYEVFDLINNDTNRTISTYDSANNLLSEDRSFLSNKDWIQGLSNTYGYEQSANTFSIINEATYGRKNLMLLYHLQGSSLNNFNPKNISSNSLSKFETTFSDVVAFEINNTIEANKSISNDFKTLLDGEVFSRFTLDFSFE